MMGVGTNTLKLFAVALTAVVDAQSLQGRRLPSLQDLAGQFTTTEKVLVAPPDDVQCPTLGELLAGTFIEMEPWSFLREINIYQPPQLEAARKLQGTYLAPTIATPAPVTVSTTTLGQQYVRIGSIRAIAFAWSVEYELRDIHDKLVSKIVNPTAFWDTTQEIYNCKGQKVASVKYKYNFKKMFMNRYTEHKIYDGADNHVANLAQDETQDNNIVGSRQYLLTLKSPNGIEIASMKKPTEGWEYGPWHDWFKVNIDLMTENTIVYGQQPSILTLIFASSLAGNAKFGPYWGVIVAVGTIALFGLCFCCMICNSRNAKVAQEKSMKTAMEEREQLLGTAMARTSATKKNDSFFACCSRRG